MLPFFWSVSRLSARARRLGWAGLLAGWLLTGLGTRAQQLPPPPDSLRAVLAAAPRGPARAAALRRVAAAYLDAYDPAAPAYARAALAAARRLPADPLELTRAAAVLVNVYFEQGQRHQAAAALALADSALRRVPAGRPRDLLTARLLYLRGDLHFLRSELAEAAPVLRRALRLSRRLGDRVTESDALNVLGLVHTDRLQFDSAMACMLAGIRLDHARGNTGDEADGLLNLSGLLASGRQYPEATAYARQALQLSESIRDSARSGFIWGYLGEFALHFGPDSLPAAERYLRRAYRDQLRNGYPSAPIYTETTLGELHQRRGRPDSARFYFGQALTHSLTLGRPPGAIYTRLALLDLQQGDTAAAARNADLALHGPGELEAEELADVLRVQRLVALRAGALTRAYHLLQREDSARLQAREVQIQHVAAALRFRYETDRAEAQARRAEGRAATLQARNRTVSVVALVLLAALAAFVFLYDRLRRSRRALAQSEAALRRADATKDQLMSIIGHDLRAPVAGLQQSLPLVRRLAARPTPENAAELTGLSLELERRTTQLGTLLDNLLHWSRAQQADVRNFPERLVVAELFQATATLYGPLAADKNVTINVEADTALPAAWADNVLVSTVLRNLTANAVKFTPAGGTVTLLARRVPGIPEYLLLTVADTGVGISPERLPTLFTLGAHRSTAGTAGERGTGLGLLVCQAFADLLAQGLPPGPAIAVASVVGQGSRFSFRLPVG